MLPPLMIFSVQVVQVLLECDAARMWVAPNLPKYCGALIFKTSSPRRLLLAHEDGTTVFWNVRNWSPSTHHRLYIFLFPVTGCPFLSCLPFPSPYLYIIPVLISLHPCFPLFCFQNTWRFRDTIQNIHFLLIFCWPCISIYLS